MVKPDPRMKTTPYAHQHKEFLASKDKKIRALLWQMRTGKTKLVIDQASYLFCENEIDGVLVFAPNGVHSNWILRELPVHGWDCVQYNGFYYSHPKRDERQPEFKEAMESVLGMKMGVLTIPIDSLQFDQCKAHIIRWMKRYPRFMVVFDESHKFGTPGSKRTKRARGLSKRATHKRILTGSVMDNSPLKAFSQYELLMPGLLGFDMYDDFKDFYAEYEDGYGPGGRTYPKLKGYKNLDNLRMKLAKYSSLVRRVDCEDLPELIQKPLYLELSSKQLAKYQEAIEELCVSLTTKDLDEVVVEILEGGPLNIKLQTITSGFIKDTEEGTIYEIVKPKDNPKVQALKELLEDTDEKVIIWCHFRYDIEMLYKELKQYNPVRYYGGVKEDEKNAAIDSFRDDPKVRLFIGQPMSAGEGLNLSAAGGMVWYSHTYNAEVRNQANERATVVGGESVWLTDLIYPGLVETRIIENLMMKAEVRESVVGQALRDYLDSMDQASTKK